MALYAEASREIVADAPWAFVFSNLVTDVWQPYVHGYQVHPVWRPFYRDVWLDLPRRRATPGDFAEETGTVSLLERVLGGPGAQGGER
jgi:hypothetical protein